MQMLPRAPPLVTNVQRASLLQLDQRRVIIAQSTRFLLLALIFVRHVLLEVRLSQDHLLALVLLDMLSPIWAPRLHALCVRQDFILPQSLLCNALHVR